MASGRLKNQMLRMAVWPMMGSMAFYLSGGKSMLTTVRRICGKIMHPQTALHSQWNKGWKNNSQFASLSIRRPTLDKYQKALNEWKKISIHKALTGLDVTSYLLPPCLLHFNPQGPHGPRLWSMRNGFICAPFQSTRPSRASTAEHQETGSVGGFQSTRPSRASTIMGFSM